MKKTIFIIMLIACILFVCGCSFHVLKQKEFTPYDVSLKNGGIISMYNTKGEVDKTVKTEGKNYLSILWDYNDVTVAYSKYRVDNQLIAVSFAADNPNCTTYGNVSVGDTWADAIEKLNKAADQSIEEYLSANKYGGATTYTLFFDDEKLVPAAQRNNAEDDWLMIQYDVRDAQVKSIIIGDIRYIQTLT